MTDHDSSDGNDSKVYNKLWSLVHMSLSSLRWPPSRRARGKPQSTLQIANPVPSTSGSVRSRLSRSLSPLMDTVLCMRSVGMAFLDRSKNSHPEAFRRAHNRREPRRFEYVGVVHAGRGSRSSERRGLWMQDGTESREASNGEPRRDTASRQALPEDLPVKISAPWDLL